MKKETIYLAGGCFWGTEKYMQGVDGVLETRGSAITADTPKRSRLSLMRKKSL